MDTSWRIRNTHVCTYVRTYVRLLRLVTISLCRHIRTYVRMFIYISNYTTVWRCVTVVLHLRHFCSYIISLQTHGEWVKTDAQSPVIALSPATKTTKKKTYVRRTQVDICAHVHVHTYVHMCAHIRKYLHTYIHTYVCLLLLICMYIHMPTCTHTG